MPKIAFSTLSCPDWGWQAVVDRGSRYGYDGVEVRSVGRETDLLSVPEFRSRNVPARRRELVDAGLTVCGLASSVRFDQTEKAERQMQIRTGRAYVDLAAELQASFVRVFGDVLPGPDEGERRRDVIGWIVEGLERLGEYASTVGVAVLIETHGDYSDSRVAGETLAKVTSPAAGVLWDTHHPWRFCKEAPGETFGRLKPWIRHTHWKDSVSQSRRAITESVRDAARRANELMSGHCHADYVLFGEGDFPALECMQLLRRAGYDGWHCYEWEKMWHPEIESPELALPPFPEAVGKLWAAAESLSQ